MHQCARLYVCECGVCIVYTTYLYCSAAPVWQIHPRLPLQLVFLLHLHPDQYCQWWHPTTALQSWVCRSLWVPGDGGALASLSRGSSCGVSQGVSWSGRMLFIGSSSNDYPGMRWSIGCGRKFLSSCSALLAVHSQCLLVLSIEYGTWLGILLCMHYYYYCLCLFLITVPLG